MITATRWRTRAFSALFAFGCLAFGPALGPAVHDARATTYSDTIEAARLLLDWRYDEARAAIARLIERAPNSAETRYLQAELAFVDGAYERAVGHLEGVEDTVASGAAGRLRTLAASTLSVVREFSQRESPGGHFVIFYPAGRDEHIVDLAGEALEAAYEATDDDLGFRPENKIRVELLSRPGDLARLSPLTDREIETTGTIALCKYGKLMIVSPRATLFGYPWMDTLAHEYTHYAVSRVSHNKVPIWLHEGLARFQQSRWRQPPTRVLSPIEEHLLAQALERNKLIPFNDMHPSMAKLPSQEAAALAFAEVYSMIGYIHERVGYRGVREILAMHRRGVGAKRAVAGALDSDWKTVQRDWRKHLRTLGLQARKALAGRASGKRVRFSKRRGADGGFAENVGVEEVSGDKARKHARLGGMLRARGMSEAAALEYEKALAAVGRPEPFLAGKLSRTYLELGRHKDAIALAEPLMAADESDASPAVTLGLAYNAVRRFKDARVPLEAAIRINPFDPSVRCALVDVYQHIGDSARAERERSACRGLSP